MNELEYKFQLPAGMVGDLVLLQWHYVTANSCMPPGYDDVDNPNTFPHHMDACTPAGTADNAEQVRIYIYVYVCLRFWGSCIFCIILYVFCTFLQI